MTIETVRRWIRLPWSARIRLSRGALREALRGTAKPERWIALTAVGWAHRDVLTTPWRATCTALLVSGAAGLLTVAINRAVTAYREGRRKQTDDADRTVTVWTPAVSSVHPEPY